MPALQVRDFPDELYEQLKELAREEHRSISQQTIACVEDYLRNKRGAGGWRAQEVRVPNLDPPAGYRPIWAHHELPPEQVEERKKLFARIAAMPVREIPDDFPDPVELIREDRDSR